MIYQLMINLFNELSFITISTEHYRIVFRGEDYVYLLIMFVIIIGISSICLFIYYSYWIIS